MIDAAANRRRGTRGGLGLLGKARIRPIEELSSQYYVALEVADRPGVLEAVARVFRIHDVSIMQAQQEGIGEDARLILITHTAAERAMQGTLSDLRELDVVDRVGSLLRVVGPE